VNVLLRVVLTLLLVITAVAVGIRLAPRLARFGAGPGALTRGTAQPDWGGGRLSFPVGSAAAVVDSVGTAPGDDAARTQTFSGTSSGAVLRQKSGADYALALVLPSRAQLGRCGLFELPSTAHFRRQLLPGAGDAEPPAADIPLYPQSDCRTQVGRGTACFVGFYLTPDSVEAVRSFYVRALGKLGWHRVTAGRPGLLETFAKSNEDRVVVVQLKEQDSVTTRIGLVAMASGSPDRSERR